MNSESLKKNTGSEDWFADFEFGRNERGLPARKIEDCAHSLAGYADPDIFRSIADMVDSLPAFSVIAIKPDSDSHHSDEERILRLEAEANGWIFAKGRRNIFFCVIPGNSSESVAAHAERLRLLLKSDTGVPVAAGTSFFPFFDFSRQDVFENSVKACSHALFLGVDSQAGFDSTSLNLSGDICYQNGDIENAINEYKKGLEIDPENTNIINSLGVCFASAKKYAEALREFEKASGINPDEYLAVYNAGVANIFLGNTERAGDFFIRAAGIDDSDIKIVFHAGKAALQKGDAELATGFLEKAACINPEKSGPYRYLGEAYQKKGDIKRAIDAYSKAVKVNPLDARSFSALGELFGKTGENIEIALVFCRQGIDIAPDDGLMHFRLGKVFLVKNDAEKALEAFKKAHSLGFDSSEEIYALEIPASEKAS